MTRPHKRPEAPERPVTFRAAENLGAFDLAQLPADRTAPVDIPVYAGVIVLASEARAQRLGAAVPDIAIPAGLARRARTDRLGLRLATWRAPGPMLRPQPGPVSWPPGMRQ